MFIEETEFEKLCTGKPYCLNEEIIEHLDLVRQKCYEMNQITDLSFHKIKIKEIVPNIGKDSKILPPFFCSFGKHIHIGDHSFINMNVTILDSGKVEIGNHVLIGPNVQIYTPIHAKTKKLRQKGYEFSKPVYIQDDVWIGGNATILPGVTIGEGSIVGAGSVVTKDIPPYTFFAGNPAQKIHDLKDEEYFEFQEVRNTKI